jgi:hypothetical protein
MTISMPMKIISAAIDRKMFPFSGTCAEASDAFQPGDANDRTEGEW